MKSQKLWLIAIGFIVLLQIIYVIAAPVGPTITFVSNTTKGDSNGTLINGTGSDAANPDKAGGTIFTILLDSVQQNSRWKAYVGNVTGSLTLDDADDYTIYDWAITTALSGEVYATRQSGSVNWSNINCTYPNATHWEQILLNHTSNPNDNLTATFNDTDNSAFYVGDVLIDANTCPTTNLHSNDEESANDLFEEVLLYDGPKTQNQSNQGDFANIVYAAIIEQDQNGFANETYDFQIIVPEIGLADFTSATAYYFYVELS